MTDGETWRVAQPGLGPAYLVNPFAKKRLGTLVEMAGELNELTAQLTATEGRYAEAEARIEVLAEAHIATEGRLADMTRERDELVFQIDVIAVAEPGWKANHVMRMAKFAADGINTHWDVVAQEKEKAILATNRAEAAEGRLAVAVQALEDMYDAWIDSDAHNRCAPGECARCDKIYADYTTALQSIKANEAQ